MLADPNGERDCDPPGNEEGAGILMVGCALTALYLRQERLAACAKNKKIKLHLKKKGA